MQDSRPRQIATLVSESFWYHWLSMGVIGVSVIAVIWTPNSSDAGPDTHVRQTLNPKLYVLLCMGKRKAPLQRSQRQIESVLVKQSRAFLSNKTTALADMQSPI